MRISEQRYARERRALDVASRLIDFEARTGTIRELTGLADGRIRKLSKACALDGRSGAKSRHRGAAPRRVNYVLDKARSKTEAAALLGVCQLMGITDPRDEGFDGGITRIARAEQLCDAFWTFRYLLPQASIGFEHMLLLLSEAVKGEDLVTAHCHDCRAFLVVDPLSLYGRLCPQCTENSPMGRMAPESIPYSRVAEESPAYR